MNIAIVNSKFVWYLSVSAIVLGHIIAVYLAHQVSFDVFRQRRHALASQYPMLALMVLYTMVSLWIIANLLSRAPPGAKGEKLA